ncbi:orotidine-5'-phosphate decarboxylase [Bartonella sp. DGB1]|uniref:orotidine-5'-phosphate decarboxylase n=1 Tax=Bartonella sp. DGB1 TaxID=3239807 RepID=UPI003523CFDE
MNKAIKFIDRFKDAAQLYSPLCIGIDPTPEVLRAWGGNDDLLSLEKYCDQYSDILIGNVAMIKPQASFFERFGSEGIKVLEKLIAKCRKNNILVLLDAKRSDIPTTMQGYAEAYFSQNSSIRVDAITVTPFLGFDTLLPVIDLAAKNGGYVFVVTVSSNPEGINLQRALIDNKPLYQHIAEKIKHINTVIYPDSKPCGAVVGATQTNLPAEFYDTLQTAMLLSPGIGAQGASIENLAMKHVMNKFIPTISRQLSLIGNDQVQILDRLESFKDKARQLIGKS